MLIAPAAMAQGDASQQSAEITYTPYMQKQMIKTYAKLLSTNYYYGVDDEELLYSVICNIIDEGKLDINSAVKAMVETLGDEYAEFYSPEEFAAITEDIAGEFSGIGVTISENKEGVVALSVFENGPAYKAGMMPYDYIIGVDDVEAAYALALVLGGQSAIAPKVVHLNDAKPKSAALQVAFVEGPDGEQVEFFRRVY